MSYNYKFKSIKEPIPMSMGFWDHIGYGQVGTNFDIDDLLEDEEQIDEVLKAIEVLSQLEAELMDKDMLKL